MDFYAELEKARREARRSFEEAQQQEQQQQQQLTKESKRGELKINEEGEDAAANVLQEARRRKQAEDAFFAIPFPNNNNNNNTKEEEKEESITLSDYEVKLSNPSTFHSLYYIPEYISEADAEQLYSLISDQCPVSLWTVLRRRRLICLGGLVTDTFEAQELPRFLKPIVKRINRDVLAVDEKQANHVLINEYEPGQGITRHQDGPRYHPVVSILSLNSACYLNFYESTSSKTPIARALLEPRSLVVFRDTLFTKCFHEIEAVHEEAITADTINRQSINAELYPVGSMLKRNKRISLTIRYVPERIGGA